MNGKVIEPTNVLAHSVATREFLRVSIPFPRVTTPVQAAALWSFERTASPAHVMLRCSRGGLPRVSQPRYTVGYQVDAEEKSEHPETCHREPRQNDEAGQNSEQSRQQHDPAGISPVADAQQDSNEARNQEQQSEDVGENQGAGDGLAHQHDADGDVQNAQKHPPQESSPSLGPEGVDDFEGTCGNGHHADEHRADNRNEHDVAQHQESRKDHHNSKQNADPKRWRGQMIGVQTRTAVIRSHAILLNLEPMGSGERRRWRAPRRPSYSPRERRQQSANWASHPP